jgi:hypothetical protein
MLIKVAIILDKRKIVIKALMIKIELTGKNSHINKNLFNSL